MVFVILLMATLLWFFFVTGAVCLYIALELKYWQNPPGINCELVLENYSKNLAQLAFEETNII